MQNLTPVKKISCLALVSLICGMCNAQNAVSSVACTGNLLVNGSFTSVKGAVVTAPGWVPYSTPDINDEFGPLNSTPGYVWTGVPLPSLDGGTWQNIFSGESISQNVILIPGQSYTLCFEYADQPITNTGGGTFSGPNAINVWLNGGIIAYTSPLTVTPYVWQTACYTFIPSTASVTIMMENNGAYSGIDGACLTADVNSSVNGQLKPEITVYGNIITDKFEVKASDHEPSEIIIYDEGSRKVMQQKFKGSVILNTSALERGIYFYEVRNQSSALKKGKVVKD